MADMATGAAECGHRHTVRLGGRPRGEGQDGREACEIRGVAAGQCEPAACRPPTCREPYGLWKLACLLNDVHIYMICVFIYMYVCGCVCVYLHVYIGVY